MAAYRDADSKVEDLAVQLGDQIGAELTRKLQVKMLTHYGLEHGANKPIVIEGESEPIESGKKRPLAIPNPFSQPTQGPIGEPVVMPVAASTKPAEAVIEPASNGESAANFTNENGKREA